MPPAYILVYTKYRFLVSVHKKAQELNMKTFVANLSRSEDKIAEWNESIWMLLVKSAIVHRDKSITFKFNNGEEIRN